MKWAEEGSEKPAKPKNWNRHNRHKEGVKEASVCSAGITCIAFLENDVVACLIESLQLMIMRC